MNCRDHIAIKRRIKFAPFAAGHNWPRSQTQRCQHRAYHHRICREHFAQQGHCGAIMLAACGGLHGASLNFRAGVFQHGTRQHILGLGVGWDAKAGHINANDSHAVDFTGQ